MALTGGMKEKVFHGLPASSGILQINLYCWGFDLAAMHVDL